MNRKEKIQHHRNMLDRAVAAMTKMLETPDNPVDLSHVPVGALGVLKKRCEVDLMFSGDNVFGIMGLTDEDMGRASTGE